MILSRASGAPVAANAIKFAADLVKGNLKEVARAEGTCSGVARSKKRYLVFGIYAESGMGCTGPVIRVSEEDLEEAMKLLQEAMQ